MDFSILGSVEAVVDGQVIALGGPRQRALLARLLVDANRAVSVERLGADLWDEPPHDVNGALQNQVSRLRKVLGDRLVTKAPGYLVRVEPGELDLERFRSLVADAGSATDLASRSRLLREADALFRGPPLADVDAPFVASEAAALEELRLAAVEGRIDTDLERGRHAELVPELSALVRTHPLRERMHGQLILALYRCGRQADALDAYRAAKRMLDEELGLEPSPALRELEHAILTHDASLTANGSAVDDRTAVPLPVEPSPRSPRWGRIALVAAGAILLVAATAMAAVLATETDSASKALTLPQSTAAAVVAHPKHKARATHPKAQPVKHVVHHVSAAARHRVVVPKQTPLQIVTVVTKPVVAKATTPAKSKQPVTTKPAPPTATLTDDFSEPAPEVRLWNPGGDGYGVTWALQNGELVFTIPADAQTGGQYNQVGPVWGSQCRFDGNFDERVDYKLLEWPAGSGARVQLTAWVFPNMNSDAARVSTQSSESYDGNIDQGYDSVTTQDLQGSLRVARKNGVETAYYRSQGAWVPIHTGRAPGRTQLGLQLFATASDWTHQQVQIAFDNFRVTATKPVCP